MTDKKNSKRPLVNSSPVDDNSIDLSGIEVDDESIVSLSEDSLLTFAPDNSQEQISPDFSSGTESVTVTQGRLEGGARLAFVPQVFIETGIFDEIHKNVYKHTLKEEIEVQKGSEIRPVKRLKERKGINQKDRPNRSGNRVTYDRGNTKRIAGAFPSEISDRIEQISNASGDSMSKVLVDLVSAQLGELSEGSTDIVTLNLPPDLSDDLRRSILKLANVITELVEDDPSPH